MESGTVLWRQEGLGRARLLAAMLVAVLLAGVAFIAAPPPAAAADAWVTSPQDGYYSFSVPNSAALEATGGVQPAQVLAEGNFVFGSTTAQFNLSSSGANWTATVGPMEPGLYIYRYRAILPDRSVVTFDNPASPADVGDQYTLFVPGDSVTWLSDVADGGAIDTLTYDSDVAGEQRTASVWTPAGYDADRAEPYPVLYLQHGEDGDVQDWVQLGRAPQILDNLAADGDIEPMVVVMGDGDVADLGSELLDELGPQLQNAYNVSSQPEDRALAGVGLGADQVLEVVSEAPGAFAYVGLLSGLSSQLPAGADAAAIDAGTDLLRLYVGNTTDPAHNPTYELLQDLDQTDIEHQFDGVNPGAGAAWQTWQESLHDLAPRLFQNVNDTGMSDGHRALTEPHELPEPGTTPTPWVDEHGMVTFETTTEFADASDVTVWANFGAGGSWPRVPMEQDGDRWRVTVGPVDPWFYYYRLMVDNGAHKDTSNPESITTEPTWSPFLVPGDEARMVTDVPEGEGGDVETLTFASSAAGGERTAYVWTPPGYDENRSAPYPVFFLQHGGGQSYTDWLEVGRAQQILENHHRDGNLADMIVVMGNGNGVNFPNELRNFLRPAVMDAYNVSDRPEHHALAGLSMGAGHTRETVLAYPEEFGYAGMFSGFGNVPASADPDAINDALRLFYLSTGDITDFTYNNTLALVNTLEERGIDHEFHIGIGPHGWDTWQRDLIDFAPRLFAPEIECTTFDRSDMGWNWNDDVTVDIAGIQVTNPAGTHDDWEWTFSGEELQVESVEVFSNGSARSVDTSPGTLTGQFGSNIQWAEFCTAGPAG